MWPFKSKPKQPNSPYLGWYGPEYRRPVISVEACQGQTCNCFGDSGGILGRARPGVDLLQEHYHNNHQAQQDSEAETFHNERAAFQASHTREARHETAPVALGQWGEVDQDNLDYIATRDGLNVEQTPTGPAVVHVRIGVRR